MAMDTESILTQDRQQVPYLICGYTNGTYINSFANDLSPNSVSEMYKDFIGKIIELTDVKLIYAHNLSGFDGILILKHLLNYEGAKVEPLVFNNRLISIKFTIIINGKKRSFSFHDSYLFLPFSLRVLCTAFKLKTPKTHFPFKFRGLNYTGNVPDIEFWPDITIKEYHKICSKFIDSGKEWNFKEEALKYCKLDCKTLFEIILNLMNLFMANSILISIQF